MSWADLVMIIVLVAFIANGQYQGMIRQVAALIGFLLGFGLALVLYRAVAQRLAPSIGAQAALEPLVFVAILFGVWITANLLGFAARNRVRLREKGGSWLDDFGGALMGLVAGVLMLIILAYGVVRLGIPPSTEIRESQLGGLLLDMGGRLTYYLSNWLPLPAWLE